MGRAIKNAHRAASEDPRGNPAKDPFPQTGRRGTFTNVATVVQKAWRAKKSPHSKPLPGRIQLARYFYLLAKLASDIPSDPHSRLFRANLLRKPPMHPRRTLDQYYFSTLKDTTSRDRDQVVYRGTKIEKPDWKHEPRIVMVDQLWLWILDDSMI